MVDHVIQGRIQGVFFGGGRGGRSIAEGDIGFGWSRVAGIAFSGVGCSVGCGGIVGGVGFWRGISVSVLGCWYCGRGVGGWVLACHMALRHCLD